MWPQLLHARSVGGIFRLRRWLKYVFSWLINCLKESFWPWNCQTVGAHEVRKRNKYHCLAFLLHGRRFQVTGNGLWVKHLDPWTLYRRGRAVALACRWHFCRALLQRLDLFSLYGINSMVVDALNKSKLLYSAFWLYFFFGLEGNNMMREVRQTIFQIGRPLGSK